MDPKTPKGKTAHEPKSARWKVPEAGDKLEALLKSLDQHSDRETAIVGHSLLEAVLEDAIRANLVAKPDSRLFGQGAPLGSFWGLFTVGHAFGVIGDGLRIELQLLNDIRNKFAHSVQNVGFDHEEIAELCRALRFPDTFIERGDPARPGMREGFMLKGATGEIGVMLFYTPEELAQPRTRFVASIRRCWFALFMLSLRVMPLQHWKEHAARWAKPPASPETPD